MVLRIIIVQSEMQSAQSLTRYFTQRGDEVWQAWELGQALALVGQIKPHLMLMDLHFASSEWLNFLRRVRQEFPEIKIIMTNRYPDLKREMLVRDLNVQVFLRQPFSARWIEQALSRLDDDTRPVQMIRKKAAARPELIHEEKPPAVRPVRFPVWASISLPYLLLALLFSLATVYLVSTGRAAQTVIFGLAGAQLLLVLPLGITLTRRITNPVLHLTKAIGQVAHGNLEVKVEVTGHDEVAALAESFNYMVAGLQESSIYRDLLGRAISPEARQQLRQTFTSGCLRLEGQQAVATVLVSDIRGFASLAEKADPATVFHWLNEYFAQIAPVVAAHGGVINKFDGDSMLAFFGILPKMLSPKQGAVAACQAALDILKAIDRLNQQRAERGEVQLLVGIGVDTGVVMAGGFGASDRLHYTIIGDPVHTTRRVKTLACDLIDRSGVFISQATYAALNGDHLRYKLTEMGAHRIKEEAEPVAIYRLDRP